MQRQKCCHFLNIERLRIQLQSQLFFQVLFLRHSQIAKIRAYKQHWIFKDASTGIQHLRQSCTMAQDEPEPFLPGIILIEYLLHQIEYSKNVLAAMYKNNAAPLIVGIKIPVFSQTYQTDIFSQLWCLW